jgi:hypothetical protein
MISAFLQPFKKTLLKSLTIGLTISLSHDFYSQYCNIASVHAEYLVSYRQKNHVIDEYGFDVELVTQLSTNMHGLKNIISY